MFENILSGLFSKALSGLLKFNDDSAEEKRQQQLERRTQLFNLNLDHQDKKLSLLRDKMQRKVNLLDQDYNLDKHQRLDKLGQDVSTLRAKAGMNGTLNSRSTLALMKKMDDDNKMVLGNERQHIKDKIADAQNSLANITEDFRYNNVKLLL